jgi:hypothetical protein
MARPTSICPGPFSLKLKERNAPPLKGSRYKNTKRSANGTHYRLFFISQIAQNQEKEKREQE